MKPTNLLVTMFICKKLLLPLNSEAQKVKKPQKTNYISNMPDITTMTSNITPDNYNEVKNTTNKPFLTGLTVNSLKAAKISGIRVYLVELPRSIQKYNYQSRFKINAYVTKGSPESNSYYIYIRTDLDKRDYTPTIAHEIIHIKQYHRGDLKINEDVVIFKGDTVNTSNISYRDREWEKEAFKKGKILKNNLDNK